MHLYLHIPFCARRCSYCDFAIAVRRTVPSGAFQTALLQEWEVRNREWPWEGTTLRTIYLGGGTPSSLSPEALTGLLTQIRANRAVTADVEITLEANPEDVTTANAEQWRQLGVNRVSLGAQSFDPGALTWMHRTHGGDQIGRAVTTLKRVGIANVSLDLIFGLPEAIPRDWSRDLRMAFALEPDHLSLYALTVEPHTPLGKWVDRGAVRLAPESRAADEFLEAHEMIVARGWHHYEVSNAARPGAESRHNLAYWRRASYLGIGPSAHSATQERRMWNVRHWEDYRQRVALSQSTIEGEEHLTAAQIRLEELYLGLRTTQGVPVEDVPSQTAMQWGQEGWAETRHDRLRLTALGWLRLDALVGTLRDF